MNDKGTNQEGKHFQAVKNISTEKELRKIIPSYPKMLDKRIQTSLDFFSLEFIKVARTAFLATSSQLKGIIAIDVKLELNIKSNTVFILKKPLTINSEENTTLNASLYFMVPGLGHGLRVNGSIEIKSQALIFSIEGIYFHCARAAARASIWTQAKPFNITSTNILHHSPFLLLKTMNELGKTELSPRGDEPGFVKQVSKKTILLPERPGNKIAVSLRNIISNEKIELLFLVPNSNKTLNIGGKAKVISDQTLLEQCSVNGKIPKTGILIQIESFNFKDDLTIDRCGIWNNKNAVEKSAITSFSKALSAHINGTGLLGKTTSAIVGAVVKHDMKNLY